MKITIPRSFVSLPEKEKSAIKEYVSKVATEAAQEIYKDIAQSNTETVVECCAMLAAVTLAKDFGWGTDATKSGKKKLKIQKFLDCLAKNASEYSGKYDEAMDSALRIHLESANIDWRNGEAK